MNESTESRHWTEGPLRTLVCSVLALVCGIMLFWTVTTRTVPVTVLTQNDSAATQNEKPVQAPRSASTPDTSGLEVPGAASQATAGVTGGKININTATRAQLEMLPRIGETLAARILEERDRNGPFASIDDLQRVSGIGERTIEQIRDLVTAEQP